MLPPLPSKAGKHESPYHIILEIIYYLPYRHV